MASRSAHRITHAPAATAEAGAVPGRPAPPSPALNTAAYARFGPSLDAAPTARLTPQTKRTTGLVGKAHELGVPQPVARSVRRREADENDRTGVPLIPVRQVHPGGDVLQAMLDGGQVAELQKLYPGHRYDPRLKDADEKTIRAQWKGLPRTPEETIMDMARGIQSALAGHVHFEDGTEITLEEVQGNLKVVIQVNKDPEKKAADAKATEKRYKGTLDRQLVVSREFTVRDKALDVKEIRTDVDSPGGAKKLYQTLLPLYERAAVSKVSLDATDIGKYAWARYGFVPSAESWAKVTANFKERMKSTQKKQRGQAIETAWKTATEEQAAVKAEMSTVAADTARTELARIKADSGNRPQGNRVAPVLNTLLLGLAHEAVDALAERDEGLAGQLWDFGEKIEAVMGAIEQAVVDRVSGSESMARLRERVVGPSGAGDNASPTAALENEYKVKLQPEVAAQILRILDSDDPKGMRELSKLAATGGDTQKFISQLLLNADTPVWSGSLNLDKPEDKQWITDYTKGGR